LSGIPLHVRGDVIGGVPGVSKAQFAKLLKLVGSKFWLHPSMGWYSMMIILNGAEILLAPFFSIQDFFYSS